MSGLLELIDLASERLGGTVVAANDEFFGGKDRLIAPRAPVWIEDRYTDRGKWMDGWETRRRREPGHDWCVIRLGARGIVRGVDVETTYFRGNFPEACALDVCSVSDGEPPRDWDTVAWREALSRAPLTGDAHNLFELDGGSSASHVRLRIFPDGGVARLRVYGEVTPDWASLAARGPIDLAAVEHGGLVLACSDMFFGPRHNLIMPGDARSMGEGWETRRRRGGGHDWTIVRLGTAGTIERVDVDTRHFKGNAPGSCSLETAVGPVVDPLAPDVVWTEILPNTPLRPDAQHVFEKQISRSAAATHVRFNIFPDGGVARLRIYGRVA